MGLEFWRVGQLRARTIASDAAELERAGWDGLLMGDNQCLAGDCYVALAIAAQATSSVKLGVGVTNPVTRLPSVTAAAAAGIQELSGGRMVLGIGRGDSALAHVGLAPSGLATFERYLRNVQAYLRGGGVPLAALDDYGQRPVTELGAAGVPEESRLRWLDPSRPKVPVDVAASGPAVIGIAARHADRVTFGVGADRERLGWAIETARAARRDAGLDSQTLGMGAFVNVVAHPDEEVALHLAAVSVTTFARFSIMHGKAQGPVDDRARATLERLARSYDLRDHASGDARHGSAVDPDYITSFGIVGTPAQCTDRLVQLGELGLDRVVILGGFARPGKQAAERLRVSREVLAAEVLPAVRARLAGSTSRAPAVAESSPAPAGAGEAGVWRETYGVQNVESDIVSSMRTPLGTITSYDGPGENSEPPRLLLAVGHPAEIADGCLNLFRSLVNGALSPRDRKLSTLAIAAAIKNAYEWHHHIGSALTMGITQADIDAIKAGETHKLAPHDRVVVELGQAVERQAVTDELWARAAAEFDTEQLVQLTVVCAYYGMLGRVQTALQVDQDEDFAAAY